MTDIKALLFTMPDVGSDADFVRPLDMGREVDLSSVCVPSYQPDLAPMPGHVRIVRLPVLLAPATEPEGTHVEPSLSEQCRLVWAAHHSLSHDELEAP